MEENVERITTKILEDAQDKSEEIVDSAKKDAKEKLDVAERRGSANKNRIISEAEKQADQTRKKMVAESKIKARTIILESKERLIGEAFIKARERLEKLSNEKDYPSILYKLTVETCIRLGGGELNIIVHGKDEKHLKTKLKTIEKEVSESTKAPCKLKLISDNISPGVIVKRIDGKVGIDSTFKNRLDLLMPSLRLKVAEVMF